MSSDIARTREGRGLSVRGGDGDKWIVIQTKTFTNWVNLQLQSSGLVVDDFETDFDDGVKLCALVEALQHRKIGKVIKKPLNHHQNLQNVSLALKAVADDNIRLVNIGSEDIVSGSQKLILGLIWMLILRYQIGKTKFPPKKLMLAWLRAVVPECRISNFTSDWNDGVALSGLIDYCQPGLFPDWRSLSRHNSLENCTNAMRVAREQLKIPMVLHPEDLASPHLDELSGMTYLSYYMMQDSPGYFATRREIRKILQTGSIDNFSTDWNDGRLLCNLVVSVGGNIPGWPDLPQDSEGNLQKGLDEGQRLGVDPIFSAQEIADPEVDHLGVMAYAAYYMRMEPVKLKWNPATLDANLDATYVGQQKTFQVHLEDGSADSIRAEVRGPDSQPPVDMEWSGSTATCRFTPVETGQHKLDVVSGDNSIAGSPVSFRVQADRSQVLYHPPRHACVGMVADMKVDVSSAGEGVVQMEAHSPSGDSKNISTLYRPGVFDANFTPTEVGIWDVSVLYDGEPIQGSPFPLSVLDPSLVHVSGLDGGAVGQSLSFNADASEAGDGVLGVTVDHQGSEVPSDITAHGQGRYDVEFTPGGAGLHTVYVTLNDMQVKDSPFSVDVVDSSLVTLSGDGISRVPVNQPATFTIHTKGAGNGKLDVDIAGPDGESLPVDRSTNVDGDVEVCYTPTLAGDHMVSVQCLGQEVAGSPFLSKAYDVGAITVTPLQDGFVGQPMGFTIDVQSAGDGQLQIMVNGGTVPNDVEAQDNGVYRISFVPETPGTQNVEILFNNVPLALSPLKCDAMAVEGEVGEMSDLVAVDTQTSFVVRGAAGAQASAEVVVLSPTGESVPCKLKREEGRGATLVTFSPAEVGTYSVSARLAGKAVRGSPFKVRTYDLSKVTVSKPVQGILGAESKFTVETEGVGEGEMEIVVTADGATVPNRAEALGQGRYQVSFIGRQPAVHVVTVTYNGQHVEGSPFYVNFVDASHMTASVQERIPRDKGNQFTITTPAANLRQELKVKITSPLSTDVAARLSDVGDGTYTVDWFPKAVGVYTVQVEYSGVAVRGSPYTVQVYDAALVMVSGIRQGLVGVPVTFYLNANNAGDGSVEIQVTADGKSVANKARQERDAEFCITFTPQRPSRHKISVTFNGDRVPGSPFLCQVYDARSMAPSGEGVQAARPNHPTSFTLHPQGAKDFQLTARVLSPFGHNVPVKISGDPHTGYQVDYIPVDIGRHQVHVELGGQGVGGSPFTVPVFDPALVRVNSAGRAYLSKPFTLHLDQSVAGEGRLEGEVRSQGSAVLCQMTEGMGQGRWEMTFTPHTVGTHALHVTFGGYPLPGSPFHVDVIDCGGVCVSGEGLYSARVNTKTFFSLDLHGLDPSDVDISITDPTGSRLCYGVGRLGHILQVELLPLVVGRHRVQVLLEGGHIQGSPFVCQAYDPTCVKVTHMDRTASKGRDIGFTVDTSAAGTGDLDIDITHEGQKVKVRQTEMGEGCFRYTFLPRETGQFEVKATFNGDNIPGCPLLVRVEEDVTPTFISISYLSTEPINIHNTRKNFFVLHMAGTQITASKLHINIEAPSGEQLDSSLVQNSDGDYRVEWTPKQPGRHSVDVLFGGQSVTGSPFFIEVFDVSRIRVDSFFNGRVDQQAGFSVDTSEAGQCHQTVRVVGPSNSSVPVSVSESGAPGCYSVTYQPVESGSHSIYLTYNSVQMPGCPFIQEVGEGELPPAYGDGLYRGEEDRSAVFYIDARGMSGDPSVQVDGPNSMAKCSLDPQSDGQYCVTYVPVEVGIYDIQIKWNGTELPGSPYHPKIVCGRKVQVVGGWQHYMDNKERVHLVVGKEKELPFDVSQAGPGKLTAEVKAPSGVIPVTVDDSALGRNIVSFTAQEEGDHYIHLFWSDIALPNAPFHGYAIPGVHDPCKVILTGRGLKDAIVHEEAEFTIDASQAGEGEPQVQLTGVKAEAKVVVLPLGGGKFHCTYMPSIPGAYLLHISWNHRQLHGSPFKVNVTGAFYPNKVVVSGAGLNGGLLSQDLDIRIDTRKAGPGELTAYCMGPMQVASCELEDHHDGTFRLIVRPQDVGTHILQVKYGEEHVRGSPFKFKVASMPDASKVRVSGPGVEHGILPTYQSRFMVETRGAGAGQLTVRIRGPKGGLGHHVVMTVGKNYLGKGHHFFFDNFFTSVTLAADLLAQKTYSCGTIRMNRKGWPDDFKMRKTGNNKSKKMQRGEVKFRQSGCMVATLWQDKRTIAVLSTNADPVTGEATRQTGRGAFQVEMYRDSQRDRTILCRYDPTEMGLYIVSVRWSGVDVPGSPFQIHILDTQAELEQVLSEQSFNTTRVGSGYGRWK